MSFNAVMQLLDQGISSDTIIAMLQKESPKIAKKVKQLLLGGYGTSEILNYLTKDNKYSNDLKMPKKPATPYEIANLATIQNKMEVSKSRDEQAREELKKATPYVIAATSMALPFAAPEFAASINPIASILSPQSPKTPTPQPPIQPGPNIGQQIGEQASQPISDAMQPASMGQMQQASKAMPSQMPQQTPIFEQLLGGVDPATLDPAKQDQLKFLAMISDQLQSKGKTLNDPEFKNLAKKIKSVVAGNPGMMTQELGRFPKEQPQENPNVNPLDIEEIETPVSIIEPSKIQKPQEIKKGESVVTEDGNLAEIKGTSGNNFLIEENGKVRQVPMDSLRSEPEAIKKAKIVFDPSKVPEKDRSAALAISLPMPDRSAIINMFHDGSFYVYRRKDGKPIEDSIIQRIIEGQDIPISTGETFMGAWNQDTGDSRGSASFKELTAMAQDATKEDDPTKPLIFEKIMNGYTHGYLTEFMKSLKEANRMFSAKPKKNKK